jgi:ankyrin repeat protein
MKNLASNPRSTASCALILLGLTLNVSLFCAQQKPVEQKAGLTRNEARTELKKRGVEFSPQSFVETIDKEDAALVKLFLAAGADPTSNEHGTTVLMITSGLHPPYPEAGGCIGGIGQSCYTIAKRDSKGALEIVRSLLENGAAVRAKDSDGKTALHHAAAGANVEVARILIAHGADVNAVDNHGTNPVNVVSLLNDDTSVTELLLNHGAEINNKNGSWPGLLSAAAAGHTRALRFLICKGANINSTGSQGTTALMEAAASGHLEIIDTLLGLGTAVDTQDAQGFSALMYAAFNGRENAVALLLKSGANKALTNRSGETAVAIAAQRKFTDIVRLLKY